MKPFVVDLRPLLTWKLSPLAATISQPTEHQEKCVFSSYITAKFLLTNTQEKENLHVLFWTYNQNHCSVILNLKKYTAKKNKILMRDQMLGGCYLENFSYFSTRNADVLSLPLSKLENIFFSLFIYPSVCLSNYFSVEKWSKHVYWCTSTSGYICFVIWRALTREKKQNNKLFSIQEDSIPKKKKWILPRFHAEIPSVIGFFGKYVLMDWALRFCGYTVGHVAIVLSTDKKEKKI